MSVCVGVWRRCITAATLLACVALLGACSSSSKSAATSTSSPAPTTTSASVAPGGVTWMAGFAAPGTPAKYDKVGVIKVGPASAKNVLVLEPGTSAGSAYFVPLAKWIVSTVSGWQVWSVERRENLLEDQSVMNSFKQGKATATQLYDYYLGYLKDPTVKQHFQFISNSTVEFAKQWGMNVAVQDLHDVIEAAKGLGGKVVLGGHSLGGSVVTAYATWDFNGRAGADDLAGLARGRSARRRRRASCRHSSRQTLHHGCRSVGSAPRTPDCSTPRDPRARCSTPTARRSGRARDCSRRRSCRPCRSPTPASTATPSTSAPHPRT